MSAVAQHSTVALQASDPNTPIYRLEAELLKLPQVDMPVEHHHCAGLYARTMRIPAGTVLTGAIHRHECFFLLRQGELAVTSADGVRYLQAGDMLVTPAGSKRAGVAVTACVVTTFHANPDNETDTQALWDLFTIPAPAVLLGADAQEVLP
jgi:quercetin dioxygenase-like cupin family protein